ncbi:MAG: RNA 2',3'-cyclic phosphodiesterase [Halodesulfurarchaeum sp.]
MRLFVSVDLPDRLAAPIADLQENFAAASGLELTDPEQAHLTLKFLGDTDAGRVGTVVDALETAVGKSAVEPFEATFEGLGVFPSIDYISVVWLGVGQGADAFRKLQAPIEEHLVDVGFEPEDHDFTPHVTLGRMKHAGGKGLVQDLVRSEKPTVGRMTVEAVYLTESTLAPDGPVYETVDTFPI